MYGTYVTFDCIKEKKQEPRYRREDHVMPLYISIPIKFYNGIARFLCHSKHFLLVFVCRLQWIVCQKVTSTRKNQSDAFMCLFLQSDFPRDSDMMEAFQCTETQTNRWCVFYDICLFFISDGQNICLHPDINWYLYHSI